MLRSNFLLEQISLSVKEGGDSWAFLCPGDRDLSYRELAVEIERLSVIFHKQELARDTVVLVYLPRGTDQCVVMTALLAYGIPALIFPSDSKLSELISAWDQLPFTALIASDQILETMGLVLGAQSLALGAGGVSVGGKTGERKPSCDFSWLLYTSGSTGASKAVMLSSENLLQRTLGEVSLFKIQRQSRLLNFLPLSHDLGLNQLMTSLYTGSCLKLFGKRLPVELAKEIAQSDADGITGMPVIWDGVMRVIESMNLEVSYQGYLTVSGGTLPSERLKKLQSLFKLARIYKTYGQTETFRTFAEVRQDRIAERYCGNAIEDVGFLLVNEEIGTECRPSEVGQLVHYGAGAMSGYWMDQPRTETKLKPLRLWSDRFPEGALGVMTGDYFRLTAEADLEFIGRKDDLVKHHGRRFFLSEIEEVLMKSNLFESVCLMQVRSQSMPSLSGDDLVVWVIPKVPKKFNNRMLTSYCAPLLPSYKIPNIVRVVTEMPMTSSNKIDRKELERQYLSGSLEN